MATSFIRKLYKIQCKRGASHSINVARSDEINEGQYTTFIYFEAPNYLTNEIETSMVVATVRLAGSRNVTYK